MVRPHLPHHLSLKRVKSTGDYPTLGKSGPQTPPASTTRNQSPTRGAGFNMSSAQKSPGELRGDHKAMALSLTVRVLKVS